MSVTMSELENTAGDSPINNRRNREIKDDKENDDKIFTIFDDRKTTLEVWFIKHILHGYSSTLVGAPNQGFCHRFIMPL